jgi:hypothetical protein
MKTVQTVHTVHTAVIALTLTALTACTGVRPIPAPTAVTQPTAAPQAAKPDHVLVVPDQLKWADVPALPPGAKIAVIEGPLNEAVPFTIYLIFPANFKVPPHWHPAIEHVTVLSGTLNMGLGDKLDTSQSHRLPVGSVAIMQPKTHHFVWTAEGAMVQVHGVGPWGINYLNPDDDPRKK